MLECFNVIKNNKCSLIIISFLIIILSALIRLFPENFIFVGSILNEYSEGIIALVSILGLFFGQSWLDTSKKKMKGRLDFDIARKYFKMVLKLRDTIKIVRAPFIPIGEMQNALQKNGFSPDDYEDKEKVNRSVYSVRWEKVQDAWSSLDEVLLDAEVSWGSKAVIAQKELDKLIRKLRSVIWLFVNNRESAGSVGEENFHILYGTHEEDDSFAKKIDEEVENIKNFLKKHL